MSKIEENPFEKSFIFEKETHFLFSSFLGSIQKIFMTSNDLKSGHHLKMGARVEKFKQISKYDQAF